MKTHTHTDPKLYLMVAVRQVAVKSYHLSKVKRLQFHTWVRLLLSACVYKKKLAFFSTAASTFSISDWQIDVVHKIHGVCSKVCPVRFEPRVAVSNIGITILAYITCRS